MAAQGFLDRDACQAVADHIFRMTTGGGETHINIDSRWNRDARWARNTIHAGGDTQQTMLSIARNIRGARGRAQTDGLDDEMLQACVKRAEEMVQLNNESPDNYPDHPSEQHPHLHPELWFDNAYYLDDAARAVATRRVTDLAERSGLVSAGYFQATAQGQGVINTEGLFRYYPYTTVQYSVTVRDATGRGSGWAGVDHNNLARIDTTKIAQIAIDKCQRSRNPVPIEPGRYTTILEPQAVCDLVAPLVDLALGRPLAESGMGPFADPDRRGYSRIGQRVIDPRLTLSADAMDPDCGFVPFDNSGEPYLPVNWIEQGILKELAYSRTYGLTQLSQDVALPNSGAFRLTGGTIALNDMIACTKRGILVTRLSNVQLLDVKSMLLTGNTRDGVWLIENGTITKPITNFRFTESPLFALNNVDAIGISQRVFRLNAPAVVPPLLVRDFSFTGLVDAV